MQLLKTKILFVCLLLSAVHLIAQSGPAALPITASDYCEFLNKTASSDEFHFYDEKIAGDLGAPSIVRSGAPGSYCYKIGNSEKNATALPVTFLSCNNVIEYCTWKNTTDAHSSSLQPVVSSLSVDSDLKSNILTFSVASSAATAHEASVAAAAADTELDEILGEVAEVITVVAVGTEGARGPEVRDEINIEDDYVAQQIELAEEAAAKFQAEKKEIESSSMVPASRELIKSAAERDHTAWQETSHRYDKFIQDAAEGKISDEAREQSLALIASSHKASNAAQEILLLLSSSETSRAPSASNEFNLQNRIALVPTRYLKVSGSSENWTALYPKIKDPLRDWFFPESQRLDPLKYNLQISSLDENEVTLATHLISAGTLLQQGENYLGRFFKKFDMMDSTRRNFKKAAHSVFLSTLWGVQQNVSHFEALAELIFKHTGEIERLLGMQQALNLPPARAQLIRDALENSNSAIKNALLFGTRLAGENIATWSPLLALPARGRAEAYGGRSGMLAATLSPTITAEEKKVREDQAAIYTKELSVWNKCESEQDDQKRAELKNQAEAYRKQIAALNAFLATTDWQKKRVHQNEAEAWGAAAEATTAEQRIWRQGTAEAYGKEATAWDAYFKATNNEEKEGRKSQALAYAKQASARKREDSDQAGYWRCNSNEIAFGKQIAVIHGKEAAAWDAYCQAMNDEEGRKNQALAYNKQTRALNRQAETCGEVAWNAYHQAKAHGNEAAAWDAYFKATNNEEKEGRKNQVLAYGKVVEARKREDSAYSCYGNRDPRGKVFWQHRAEIHGNEAAVWGAYCKAASVEVSHFLKQEAEAWSAAGQTGISEEEEKLHQNSAEFYGASANELLAASNVINANDNTERELYEHLRLAYHDLLEAWHPRDGLTAEEKTFYQKKIEIYKKEVAAWRSILAINVNDYNANVLRYDRTQAAEFYREAASAWNAAFNATSNKEKEIHEYRAVAYEQRAEIFAMLRQIIYYSFSKYDKVIVDEQNFRRKQLGLYAKGLYVKEIEIWNALLKTDNHDERYRALKKLAMAYKNQAEANQEKIKNWNRQDDLPEINSLSAKVRTTYDNQVVAYKNVIAAWDQSERATVDHERSIYQNQAKAYQNQGDTYNNRAGRALHETIYDADGKINQIKKRVHEMGLDLLCSEAAAYEREALAWSLALTATTCEERMAREHQASSYRKQAEGYGIQRGNDPGGMLYYDGRRCALNSMQLRSVKAYEQQINLYGEQAQLYRNQATIFSSAAAVEGEKKEGLLNQAKAFGNQAATYNVLDWDFESHRDDKALFQGCENYFLYMPASSRRAACLRKADAYAREESAWADYAKATTQEERAKYQNLAMRYQRQAEKDDVR